MFCMLDCLAQHDVHSDISMISGFRETCDGYAMTGTRCPLQAGNKQSLSYLKQLQAEEAT